MSLIGAHVSVSGGLHRAIERGEALGCEAIQIFTKNQLQWRASPIPQAASERFLKAWIESSIRKVVAHGSYLINLAGSNEIRKKSIDALSDELLRCDQLGIDDLVLHPGSHRGDGWEVGFSRVVSALEAVLDRTESLRVRILLETMAGQGDGIGSSLEELAALFDALEVAERIGICLDTCHLFVAGYEIRSREGYERILRRVDKYFGLERVGCWHLNDSKEEKGVRRDRHQHIGAGKIGNDAFGRIVSDPRWEDTPCIIETPKEDQGDVRNLSILRKLRGF
ncbi:MAG TPA: endonuclease [Synergistaceae bacterium]|nr:MAG: putative endonuclease 4 [Synergistales bacterium 53_16]KUL04450.1 MAG: putative endonuclease 4 [Synergistales bacterium 54_9]MDN5335829.1 deoxyribonuclease [Synergistales bacterium]HAA47478.1 endonuclease [Synergistaceae bacterium]HAG22301.1 endonuclease [Synergistaceae bacterium]